ncbi:hypothetical protein BH11PLA1_BH11PLA1_15000 [soil metagenome]
MTLQMSARKGAMAAHRAAAAVSLSCLAIALSAGSALAGTAYQNGFNDPVGDEWSIQQITTSPSGEKFLGTMASEKLSLKLNKLVDHSHIVLACDLLVIGDWKGSTQQPPQKISIIIEGKKVVLDATFANEAGPGDRLSVQSYPYDANTKLTSVAGSGAYTIGTLGYHKIGGRGKDTIYRLVFTVQHSGPELTIEFEGAGLPESGAAVWGLDNVVVETFMFDLDAGFSPDLFGPGFGGPAGYGGSGGIGSNPLRDIPPNTGGGGGGDGGGGGGTPPHVPAPGAGVVLGLAGWSASRRRR